MIQRIQSIYLFLSSVCMVLLSFLPIGKFSTEDPALASAESTDILPLLITVLAGAAISFLTIFLFKNRILQKNIAKIGLLAIIVSIGLMVFYFFIQESTKLVQLFPTGLLAIGSAVFIFLAIRGISKDENLVRSMDRLR